MDGLEQALALTKQNNEWSAQQAQKQMDFQERMSNTAHQREIEDLKAAGLNPVLSAKLGGASTPNGAMADTDTSGTSAIIDGLLASSRAGGSAASAAKAADQQGISFSKIVGWTVDMIWGSPAARRAAFKDMCKEGERIYVQNKEKSKKKDQPDTNLMVSDPFAPVDARNPLFPTVNSASTASATSSAAQSAVHDMVAASQAAVQASSRRPREVTKQYEDFIRDVMDRTPDVVRGSRDGRSDPIGLATAAVIMSGLAAPVLNGSAQASLGPAAWIIPFLSQYLPPDPTGRGRSGSRGGNSDYRI